MGRQFRPRNYWKSMENQRSFLEFVKQQFNLQTKEDWYQLTARKVRLVKGGGTFITLYKGSLHRALKAVYPEETWWISNFRSFPPYYWHNLERQYEFLEDYYHSNNMQNMEEWHKVSISDFTRTRGGYALLRFHRTLFSVLLKMYPNYPWNPLLTSSKHKLYFLKSSEEKNTNFSGLLDYEKKFLRELLRRFFLEKKEDFYRVSIKQRRNLMREIFGSEVRCRESYADFLNRVFPREKWDFNNQNALHKNKKSSQRFLYISLRSIFPHLIVLEDYYPPDDYYDEQNLNEVDDQNKLRMKKRSKTKNQKENSKSTDDEESDEQPIKRTKGIEFDVFIPAINLVFEYQATRRNWYSSLQTI